MPFPLIPSRRACVSLSPTDPRAPRNAGPDGEQRRGGTVGTGPRWRPGFDKRPRSSLGHADGQLCGLRATQIGPGGDRQRPSGAPRRVLVRVTATRGGGITVAPGWTTAPVGAVAAAANGDVALSVRGSKPWFTEGQRCAVRRRQEHSELPWRRTWALARPRADWASEITAASHTAPSSRRQLRRAVF